MKIRITSWGVLEKSKQMGLERQYMGRNTKEIKAKEKTEVVNQKSKSLSIYRGNFRYKRFRHLSFSLPGVMIKKKIKNKTKKSK